MKRLSIVMSVFIALAVAAPSFAVEFDATGTLRFQGVYNDKAESGKDDKAVSYRDMRLRVRTELKVNDKITLVTRFDALDKVLSSEDSAIDAGQDDDNIDFDRAYMRIVSPIGLFIIGRQEGVTWGTSFADDEDDTDRIVYVLPIPVGDDKLYIGAVAEKVGEYDMGVDASGKDNDKYYISATYKAENFKAGFLTGFYHFNTFQDPGQAVNMKTYNEATAYAEKLATDAQMAAAKAGYPGTMYQAAVIGGDAAGQAYWGPIYNTENTIATDLASDASDASDAATAAAVAFLGAPRGPSASGKVWLMSPYFMGKFGGLGISTELDYITGTVEYDNTLVPSDDRDVTAYSFMFETTYDAGSMGFQIGFATSSGDSDFNDDKVESMGYVSPGVDWGKMFILSADDHGMNTTLGGGMGNLSGDGFGSAYTTLLAGYQMFYLGADFDLNESMNVGTVMCISKADDAPAGYDDDHGYEVDVKFSWKIMDNLEYSSTVAYLATGEYWDAGTTVDAEDTVALFHKLELTF